MVRRSSVRVRRASVGVPWEFHRSSVGVLSVLCRSYGAKWVKGAEGSKGAEGAKGTKEIG